MARTSFLAACLAALLLCGAGSAVGQAPDPAAASQQELSTTDAQGKRPWADGVSNAQQEQALALFTQANALLRDSLFVQAAATYRQALAVWDHPGIHYNLALALLNLDQPLAVHEHLKAALRHGPAPLEADKYTYARNYLVLVERQLSPLEVSCQEDDARVELDGQPLFQAPGTYTGLLRPGNHALGAAKPGYARTERSITLVAGQASQVELKLYRTADLIAYKRRWAVWPPLLVTGVGALLVGTGAIFSVLEKDKFDAYDRHVAEHPPSEPAEESALAKTYEQGERYHKLAVASYAVGGAAFVTGVVLLVVNRSKPYRVDPQERERAYVTALAGPRLVGLVAAGRF